MATNIPAEYPAEETHEGVALQRVNAINPRTGEFRHQVVFLGTEEEARALAELGFWERGHARWNQLYAVVNGLQH